MHDLYNLTGRFAIITGGAGLLGFNHAKALLQKGCKVELWDIDGISLEKRLDALSEEFGSENISVRIVNVGEEAQVISAVESINAEIGKVDVLINNAALNPKFDSVDQNLNLQLENYSVELWERELAVGLTGSLICAKNIGKLMSAHKNGVILNIASDLSVIAPNHQIYRQEGLLDKDQYKKPVSYSVIKTGLIGLTRYLATYWADDGVRVNALSPGGVYDNQNPEFVTRLTSLIPLGRMARDDEYIGAIQFLCSDASAYMTGQNIVIDGGRSVW